MIQLSIDQAAAASQCDLILARLEMDKGQPVPMPALAECSGAYAVHSRIADLRKRGHNIRHTAFRDGRVVRSFYTLLEEPF